MIWRPEKLPWTKFFSFDPAAGVAPAWKLESPGAMPSCFSKIDIAWDKGRSDPIDASSAIRYVANYSVALLATRYPVVTIMVLFFYDHIKGFEG